MKRVCTLICFLVLMSMFPSIVYALPTAQADTSGPPMGDNLYYSSGWIVGTVSGLLAHTGETPSFKSDVLLFTYRRTGCHVFGKW